MWYKVLIFEELNIINFKKILGAVYSLLKQIVARKIVNILFDYVACEGYIFWIIGYNLNQKFSSYSIRVLLS